MENTQHHGWILQKTQVTLIKFLLNHNPLHRTGDKKRHKNIMQSLQPLRLTYKNKIKQVHWVELLVFNEVAHIGALQQERKKRAKQQLNV